MFSEKYELLKSEIPSISEQIKLFPLELQEKVFNLLVSTLLGNSVSTILSPNDFDETIGAETNKNDLPSELEVKLSSEPRNYVQEFKTFFNEKVPDKKLNAIEFTAFVAYFFKFRAPEANQLDEITKETLEEAYRYVPIKPPGDLNSAMSNAKNKRGFLDSGEKPRSYKITPAGEYFINHDLPKAK